MQHFQLPAIEYQRPPRQQTPADRSAILQMRAAQTRLRGHTTCILTAPIKYGPKSDVFLGRLAGQKVVVKLFHSADSGRIACEAGQELDHVSAQMGKGPHRINRCIAALPDAGAIILTRARGMRLNAALSHAAPDLRAKLVHQAGRWLGAYIGDRRRSDQFSPQFWLRRLDRQPIPLGDAALLTQLRTTLHDMAQELKFHPVTKAATHGDFSGSNLIFANGVLTGVDVQGETWLPIARDIACFLTWARVRETNESMHTTFGLVAADLAAMLATDILPPADVAGILPFFIGTQFYLRLCHPHTRQHRLDTTREAICDYLANWERQRDMLDADARLTSTDPLHLAQQGCCKP